MIGELMYFVEPETGMTWDDMAGEGEMVQSKRNDSFFSEEAQVCGRMI